VRIEVLIATLRLLLLLLLLLLLIGEESRIELRWATEACSSCGELAT
jgi:hypothetical protein